MFNWNQIFIGIQICLSLQLILVSILNFLDKKNKNTFLGVFCLLLIQVPIIHIFRENINSNSIIYAILGSWKGFFYGPILYLYLKSLNPNKLKTKTYLHLIIPSFLCGLSLIGYFLFNSNGLVDISTHKINSSGLIIKSIGYVFYWVLIIFYFIKGIKEFKFQIKLNLKSKPKLRFYSFYVITNIHLLTTIIPGLILFLAINTNLSFIEDLNTQIILPYYRYIAMPQYMLLFVFLIFYCTTESKLIKNMFLAEAIHLKTIRGNELQLANIFEEYFDIKEIYKNVHLTIDEFSVTARLTKPEIRNFVTNKEFKSFTDYVNNYRVESFKKTIIEEKYEKYDLNSLAELSGFNSKASFYRVFKRHTGMTPAEYKKYLSRVIT